MDKLHATEPGVRQVVRHLAEAGAFEGREFTRFLSFNPIFPCSCLSLPATGADLILSDSCLLAYTKWDVRTSEATFFVALE